jgi:hypothetical protein
MSKRVALPCLVLSYPILHGKAKADANANANANADADATAIVIVTASPTQRCNILSF